MYWYRRAFKGGDSCAASNIAILFRERGSHRHMLHWFRVAAKHDDGDALVEVAKCYLNGHGAPKSKSMAVAYARKALRSSRITLAGREEAVGILSAL
jgi:TPR repeat protein